MLKPEIHDQTLMPALQSGWFIPHVSVYMFSYALMGCATLLAIASLVRPNIGVDEVVFTEQSDEPRKHMDSAEFSCGGLAEKYTYVVEGIPVGVTKGAPDCCEPIPAYNENVVEFKVDKWYFTSYVPYAEVGNFGVIFFTFTAMAISIVWLFLLITITFFKYVIIKYKNTPHVAKSVLYNY